MTAAAISREDFPSSFPAARRAAELSGELLATRRSDWLDDKSNMIGFLWEKDGKIISFGSRSRTNRFIQKGGDSLGGIGEREGSRGSYIPRGQETLVHKRCSVLLFYVLRGIHQHASSPERSPLSKEQEATVIAAKSLIVELLYQFES